MFDPNSQPAMYPKNAFGYCFSSVKTNLLLLRWETSCFIPDWSYSN
jgi:hypothetical protein